MKTSRYYLLKEDQTRRIENYRSVKQHSALEEDETVDTAKERNLRVQRNQIEMVLSKLPDKIKTGSREVLFDKETLPQTQKDEYASYPYRGEYDPEGWINELSVEIEGEENPIEYIKKFIREKMPAKEEMDHYSSGTFQYIVSIYPPEERIGLLADIQEMNFPDDSVGGFETRIDFLILNRNWSIDWAGARVFCWRPHPGTWKQASQSCL